MNALSGKNRPTGVTIIAILEILLGLGSLGVGFILAVMSAFLGSLFGGVTGSEGVTFSAGAFGDLIAAVGGIIGGIIIIIGLLNFAIAYGLLKGHEWAWILCLIFAVISIVFGILLFPVGIIAIIFDALIIYYLTRRNVKEFFGKTA